MDVFSALDSASKATEKLNQQVNIDKMEELQEKLEDQKADMDERADFFIRAGGQEGDNDELLEELNQLEADALANELEAVEIGGGAIKNHGQTTGFVTSGGVSAKNDEDELRQLEAMMS